MSTATDRLRAIATAAEVKPWVQAPFAPAVPDDIRVLAFDQSLAATGWAYMAPGHPFVLRVGMIKTAPQKGHEGNLSRGVDIFEQVSDLMGSLPWVDLVVHETPPVGPAMMRPESSILSALSVRIAVRTYLGASLTMKAAQSAKTRLTGHRDASKSDLREGLTALWPHLPGGLKPWNEHIRDAVVLGILAMEDPNVIPTH